MNHHPHAPFLSCTQPLRLERELLEDETNHDTPMKNYATILKLEYEIATTSLERLKTLRNNGGEEILSSLHLDPYGLNIVMSERSSQGGIQRAAFQTSMK